MSTTVRGRTTATFRRLAKIVRQRGRQRNELCCRCKQDIDYTLRWPDPASFSTDHYPFPLSTHPHLAEDLSNLAPSHLRCNQSAGDKTEPELGMTSRDW